MAFAGFASRAHWAAVGAFVLALLLPAGAHADSACSAEDFCVSESLTLSTGPPGLIAAAPMSVDLTVANASDPLDRAHWMESVTVLFPAAGPGDPPLLTPSALLPDKLLIAGGGTCAPPSYSGCAGGHGTIAAHVTPLIGFPFDTEGAFGIEKIVNVKAAPAGALADYKMTLNSCITLGGTCQSRGSEAQEIIIPAGSAGELTLPTEGSAESFGSAIEFTITSLSFHLDGQSNRIDGQAALPQSYTILSTPERCGPLEGAATFVSHETGTVSIPHAYAVSGCPSAVLSQYGRWVRPSSSTEVSRTARLPGARSQVGTGASVTGPKR